MHPIRKLIEAIERIDEMPNLLQQAMRSAVSILAKHGYEDVQDLGDDTLFSTNSQGSTLEWRFEQDGSSVMFSIDGLSIDMAASDGDAETSELEKAEPFDAKRFEEKVTHYSNW
jgi:hypothetical protein